MREWVEDALAQCVLSEEARGYLLARGAKPETIDSWGITTWTPPSEPAPDEEFRKRLGEHGEVFNDRIIIPLRSPRGVLLGWDSRSIGEKAVLRWLIGDRPWCVCWVGLQVAMDKIWEGCDPWIVEGAFDVFALQHALPDEPVLGAGPARLVYSQVEFLRRFCKHVNLVFDRDTAGRKGSQKALADLQDRGVSCREIAYGRADDDPGKIWDRGGAEAMRREFPYHN